MQKLDYWIHRQLRRLQLGVFLGRAAEWLAAFLLFFGGAVLASKLWLQGLWPNVLYAGLAVVPLLIAAWWRTRPQRYERGEAAIVLDERLDAGGLIMSLAETGDTDWESRLPKQKQRWQDSLLTIYPARFFRVVALPALFAFGACLVPLREAVPEGYVPKSVGRQTTAQLNTMLDWMDEAHVLTPEDLKELRDGVGRLEQEIHEQPITHEKWETIDNLRNQLLLRLDTSERLVAKAQQALARLTNATNNGEPLSPQRTDELQKDILETLKKLAERGAFSNATSSQLTDELKRLLKNNQFQLPGDLQEKLAQLQSIRELLDREAKALGQCRGRCRGGSGTPGDGESGNGQSDGVVNGAEPGSGGVTRGRGDAALTFGKESDEKQVKFKQVVLPPGFLDDPTNVVTETQSVAPQANPAESAPRAGAQEFDSATGREARTRSLRPRHREAVREYFGKSPVKEDVP